MWIRTFLTAATTGAILATAQPAAAIGPGGFVRDFAGTVVVNYTSSIKPIEPQSDNIGCRSAAVACGGYKFVLTAFREGQLKRINASYNRSLAVTAEELAIAKRAKLVAMGFPARTLKIESFGEAQALVVRTDKGDLMLGHSDNTIIDIDRIVTAAVAK